MCYELLCEIDFTHSLPFIQLHGIFVYKILNYFILCNKNIFVKSRLIAQVFRNLKSVMGFSFLATKFKLCLFWCLILSLSLNHFIFSDVWIRYAITLRPKPYAFRQPRFQYGGKFEPFRRRFTNTGPKSGKTCNHR